MSFFAPFCMNFSSNKGSSWEFFTTSLPFLYFKSLSLIRLAVMFRPYQIKKQTFQVRLGMCNRFFLSRFLFIENKYNYWKIQNFLINYVTCEKTVCGNEENTQYMVGWPAGRVDAIAASVNGSHPLFAQPPRGYTRNGKLPGLYSSD